MEILSTGDKIKRARIYEGITLKELCEDKISISKMSCIENGKIKADEETIRYIAKKLNVEYDYLVQDIEGQIKENMKLLDKGEIDKKELNRLIDYNLKFAMEYEHYDLAFKLIHRLFKEYIKNNNFEHMQLIIAYYYEVYQKNHSKENSFVYYEDMASFFMKVKEYYEAINYYNKILNLIAEEQDVNIEKYTYVCFKQGICYKKIGNLDDAYSMLDNAIKNIEYIKSNKDKGYIYHEYSNLGILLSKVDAEKYIEKSYTYLSKYGIDLAKAKEKNGRSYYKVGQNEKAKKEILSGIDCCPKDDNEKFVEVLMECVETFYNNQEYEIAIRIIDEALNLSIYCDNDKLIERAYYFKGMILQKKGEYIQAETFMNISTDYFLRYANREETYKRYNEMAELYYNIGEFREAVKYFTLAMNLEKKDN